MNILGLFGRSRAFEQRLAESRPRLYRLALSWCRNRSVAEDVVQETLSKALAQAGQLRDPEAMHGWLLTILANCWKDHYRRCRETENVDIDDVGEHLPADDATPEEDCCQNQVVRRVREAVLSLPPRQRQVVTLVDLEECSYAEVASILEIPVGTVMSRLSRARQALRELLLDFQAPALAAASASDESHARLARIK